MVERERGEFPSKKQPLPWALLFIFLFVTVAIAVSEIKRAEEAPNEAK